MDATSYSQIHRALLYLPVLTTFFAAFFATQLFTRYRHKGGGPHLLWWGIGMITYGIGTFTEAFTTIAGWNPFIFRCWYIAGAFLGGYPLAQGSIYLLMNRRFANWSARIVTGVIALGAIFVFMTPLDVALAEAHRLSGAVIEWHWIRLMTPFINIYSVLFLAGGALYSAFMLFYKPEMRNRFVGNILIAIGAILPAIGGTATRFGYVEVLYVTELAGLLCIYAGYRKCIAGPRPDAVVAARTAVGNVSVVLALLLVFGVSAALPGPAAASDETRAKADTAEAAAPVAPESDETSDGEDEKLPSFFAKTTVTATGSKVETFEITTPVTVITAEEIESKAPYNAADLLRAEPGVDVNGVGPNQARPIIRGQRGLRVLFLENGLRMNNARRQSDFGEITGLVDLDDVETVEVVRGPASVLYGSDAIGGVLNLVTKTPAYRDGERFGGTVSLRASSADDQRRGHAALDGRTQKTWWSAGFSTRNTDDYEAPGGTYGNITLEGDTPVVDTGLDDDNFHALLGFQVSEKNGVTLRYDRYRAGETGFGFVPNSELGIDDPFNIRIFYPFQDFDRFQASYLGSALEGALADSVDVKLYYQTNERQLANDIDGIDIGPIFPGAPDSFVEADTLNFTDLDTLGLRLEAFKLAAGRHLLTYGLEAYEDDSFNTDHSETRVILNFPGPPFQVVDTSTDDVANAPNATNNSYGVFLQDEIEAGKRLKVTLGARYQKVATRAEATPGWDVTGLDFDDDAVVGSVNLLYGLSDHLKLLASYGTAFRAPNIIERLFNGPTPEGAGFQILNPELKSEKSDNVDVGIKYQRSNAFLEATYFRTEIADGIVQNFLSPAEVAALPQEIQDAIEASGGGFVVQQINAEELRFEGIELATGWRSQSGVSLGLNFTHLDGKRIDTTQPPTGDTFADKWNGFVRYQPRGGRFWVEYRVRRNGTTDANLDPDEPLPPVGEKLPSFTVHTLGGGVTLFERGRQQHTLNVAIDNLTNELYAEFSNATFFRPQPKRNVIATYQVRF